MPSLCIVCGDPIDLEAVTTSIERHEDYLHTCGRRLYAVHLDPDGAPHERRTCPVCQDHADG